LTEPTETPGSWIVPGVLVVLILALLVTSGVTWSKRGDEVDPGMLVAARTQAKNFVSLDYRHAEEDVDRVLALSTGKFKKEYAASKDQLVAAITSKKLVTVGSIPRGGSAVEFADDDTARVLVSLDVTRTIGTKTDSIKNRTRLVLTRVDGRWLVSDVNEVP